MLSSKQGIDTFSLNMEYLFTDLCSGMTGACHLHVPVTALAMAQEILCGHSQLINAAHMTTLTHHDCILQITK